LDYCIDAVGGNASLKSGVDAACSPEDVEAFNDRPTPVKPSPATMGAFAVATSRIWEAVQAYGFEFVFAHLDRPTRWA
jgi:hypothetical protein